MGDWGGGVGDWGLGIGDSGLGIGDSGLGIGDSNAGAASAASFALAPPPAKAGGGWEGVLTARTDPKGTPPQPVRPASTAGVRSLAREPMVGRSEERRVGKEWVSTCRSRWAATP